MINSSFKLDVPNDQIHPSKIVLNTLPGFLEGSYPGFDWFTATVFLAFNGNREKAWNFLYKLSSLGSSGYIWIVRLHSSVSQNCYCLLSSKLSFLLLKLPFFLSKLLFLLSKLLFLLSQNVNDIDLVAGHIADHTIC